MTDVRHTAGGCKAGTQRICGDRWCAPYQVYERVARGEYPATQFKSVGGWLVVKENESSAGDEDGGKEERGVDLRRGLQYFPLNPVETSCKVDGNAVTGKPIGLKKLVPGGNLLVMNSDMDAAQILGFTRSAMKHNVPKHSNIPNDTPAEQERRESNARTKEFNEQLKKLTGTSGSRKAKSTGVLTAGSSGRVNAVAPQAGELAISAPRAELVASSVLWSD
ncbi:hypothetical protein C8F04DRAFT_1190559 [Mycena alexandri]|uniref:Uncharacterized protein n=1 Tax=Mycena alexandri TaxID=1745969 RepID=A0AAD6SEW1_9AGAR|nr:hypothetical protein C8F04DRAFT_1190559 [Mycena alexandri]